MIVFVSGVSHSTAIADSGIPSEEGWPTPVVQRVGKGRRYRYDVDVVGARQIEWLLDDMADVLDGCGDEGASGQQRALRRDAARIRAALDG